MKKIEVKILNPEVIENCEKMMICGARLTQRGHSIKNLNDFLDLYNSSYKEETAKNIYKLPHPTIQKLGVINIVVIGASRRFLAQITRHQNEVKFVSASLQYSNYSGEADFVIPYEILEKGNDYINLYLETCKKSMDIYKSLTNNINHDACGYIAPQGLRNILIISATPFQWKHMISQRSCKRNTKETMYIMLKIWEELYKINPNMFNMSETGPECMRKGCLERKMSCLNPIKNILTPTEILRKEFPLIYENRIN